MTVNEKIKALDLSKPIDEKQFYELAVLFRDDFLETKDYDKNRAKHRKPKVYLNEVLQASFDRLGEIGRKEEMRDVEIKDGKTSQGFVYSRVKWIVEADRGLNLYNAISEYCKMTGKDFNIIALLMAEYRGLEKVRGRIRKDSRKLDRRSNVKTNAENGGSAASDLLMLRSKMMSSLPQGNFLSLLAMHDRVAKMTSTYDFMIQAAQKQPSLFTGVDAIAKMISADSRVSRTIRSAGMISKMFDFKPVPQLNIDHYSGILAMLADNYAVENLLSNATDDNLLEVEYELSQMGDQLNEKETESQVILVNEACSIRKVILDIYNNHHRLLEVTSWQFEEMIAELLSNQGFKVELTKQTRDGGYDIIAICDFANQYPQKWLVECKRLTRQKVGVEIIRSFKEVIQANHVNRGIIATTSYFSADALKKQQETPYLLDFRDKDDVMNWIIDYGNQKQ